MYDLEDILALVLVIVLVLAIGFIIRLVTTIPTRQEELKLEHDHRVVQCIELSQDPAWCLENTK